MKTEQSIWTSQTGWQPAPTGSLKNSAHLALIFGSTEVLEKQELLEYVRSCYPGAILLGCSTSGEISSTQVTDDSLVVTAVSFMHTEIVGNKICLKDLPDSYEAGARLAGQFSLDGLTHIFVLSDGSSVNGSELVRGLASIFPETVSVTGGLAGNAYEFRDTLVMLNGKPEKDIIAAVGFYGNNIHIGYGSVGGWDSFGPERLVTRSKGNILYELDNRNALDLYKTYLGPYADDLPASGLLFPLNLKTKSGDPGVVRTILSIDEKEQSLTFAGDIPEGSLATLMKANFDRLIEGAIDAAKVAQDVQNTQAPQLALLISCVGRKLVLKQRVDEEIEGVSKILGVNTLLTGFYSYGEISPFMARHKCELHNQTMTITTLFEE
ncbi:MAG: FIST signal transduction protein [Syntrophothermus sp.]